MSRGAPLNRCECSPTAPLVAKAAILFLKTHWQNSVTSSGAVMKTGSARVKAWPHSLSFLLTVYKRGFQLFLSKNVKKKKKTSGKETASQGTGPFESFPFNATELCAVIHIWTRLISILSHCLRRQTPLHPNVPGPGFHRLIVQNYFSNAVFLFMVK